MKKIRRMSFLFHFGMSLTWALCLFLSAVALAAGPTVPNPAVTMPNLEGLKLAALSFGRDQLNPKVTLKEPQTKVPNVVGFPLQQARTRLNEALLNVSKDITLKTTNQRQQDATVAAQDPLPGQQVKQASIVNLTIYKYVDPSQMPAEVAVPLVVNKTLAEARQLLEQQGFQVTVTTVPVPTQKPDQDGMVARQSLAGIQKRGTKIELTLYKLLKLPGK